MQYAMSPCCRLQGRTRSRIPATLHAVNRVVPGLSAPDGVARAFRGSLLQVPVLRHEFVPQKRIARALRAPPAGRSMPAWSRGAGAPSPVGPYAKKWSTAFPAL